MSQCPECAAQVPILPNARVTSIVVCPRCQMELEIVSLQPLALALAPEIEEDFGE